MLLFLSLTQFMGAVTILLVKIAFKTYLSSLSLILTMANSKRTVYMCQMTFSSSPLIFVIIPIMAENLSFSVKFPCKTQPYYIFSLLN